MTFNSKLPDCPAIVMVESLPITCAETMAVASAITGLTLPGMIEEPGCRASNSISPRPASGPEFHPAEIVGDLHECYRGGLQLSRYGNCDILRTDKGEEAGCRFECQPRNGGYLLAELRRESRDAH